MADLLWYGHALLVESQLDELQEARSTKAKNDPDFYTMVLSTVWTFAASVGTRSGARIVRDIG